MSTTRKPILWATAVLTIVALPTIAIISPKIKKKPQMPRGLPTASTKPANPAPVPISKSKEQVEGEIIAVTSHGFEPVEITRPHKHFILVIDNRSGLAQLQLRLDREHGSRVREVPMPHEKRNWSDDLDLQPGRYILSEANHPAWICHITVATN